MILFIAIAFILSINSAFAVEDTNEDLSIGTDSIEVHTHDIQSDEALTLDNDIDNSLGSNQDDVIKETNPITVKMGKVTKRYNGAIEYQATFYDNDGNPLKNQDVYFEVDDSKDYISTTDSNGIGLLTVSISNGNHKIAALNPETLDMGTDTIKVFKVITGNKNLNVYYDSGSSYKVRIYDDNGNPVKAGKKVTFYIGNSKKYTIKTDKKGYAALKIKVNPGYYEIGVKYNNYMVINTLKVKQVLKSLTSFKPRAVKSTITYKVKFLGKNNKNKKITVKFNKRTYKAKTNKKGIATFVLKTPKKNGQFKLVASYKNSKITSIYSKYRA